MTMKTLEDFDLMTVPVLEGLITNITGNKPKGKLKPELVQMAYDLQQVDPEEEEPTEDNVAKITAALEGHSDDALLALAVRLNLGVAENEARADLIARIAVVETLEGKTDEELEAFFNDQAEPSADDGEGDADEDTAGDLTPDDDLIGDEPEDEGTREPVRPAKVEFAHSTKDAVRKDVASALAHLDVVTDVQKDCVVVSKGGKRMTTTLKQPLHVIVKTVETFAR